MAAETSWRLLLEDLKRGYVTPQEARVVLDEISYDLDEEKVEEIEDVIFQMEEKELVMEAYYLDSVPSEYADEDWTSSWSPDDDGFGE